MLGVLLVASLITTAGEADAAAPAVLDGCVAAPIGEDGWDYGCAGSNARVVDDPRHIDPETYLAGARGGARARVERPLDFAREHTRLGGREAEVLRTTGGDVVEVTALVALPDGTRVLDCA